VKSAILLAALGAEGETRLGEPVPTRAHTETLLPRFGVAIEIVAGERREIRLRGPQRPRAATLRIPADPSAAAFFGAAAALLPGSSIRLDDVLLDAHRTAFFALLRRMGARVELRECAPAGSCEPSGTITVEHAPLRAVEVAPHEAAALIDELPLVAVLGAAAAGVTRVRGAAELRWKESDRIEAIAAGLAGLGASVRTAPDGFEVLGPARLRGATVDARDDHRIAMALSIAALAAEGATIVRGFDAVDVSYPRFASDLGGCLGGSPFEPV
jgi:3-phosphoshikimate 1-carboxyvinyltransferase